MASDWKQYRSVLELLDRFYCWKSTLREYLEYVFLLNNIDEKSRKAVFSDDSNRFDALLDGTIICCGCDVDVVPRALTLFDAFCYQDELVKRVIEVNCRKGQEAENVLSRGFSMFKHDSKRKRLPGSFGVQIDHPNTVTSYICSEIWQDFCTRIGCDLMLHILQNMSLFHKMARNNLFQVTGTIVDKSKVKARNHSCNGQFLDFVKHLAELNARTLSPQSQESLLNNSEAVVSIGALEAAYLIDQSDELPGTPAFSTGPVSQNVPTSTPIDDMPKRTNSANAAASPFDHDNSLLGLEFPVKLSRKRVYEIRWLWDAMTDRDEDAMTDRDEYAMTDRDEIGDSEEYSEDGAMFIPDFPKRHSRDNSRHTNKLYNSEAGSCITQQPPLKRKWPTEALHVGMENKTSMRYNGIEECNISAILENDIPSWSPKNEIIASEKEEDTAEGFVDSPGIVFSTPKKLSRVSLWRAKERHNSDANSYETVQRPGKRKRWMEEDNVEMTSRANMCYIETEENSNSTNVEDEFSSRSVKHKILDNKSYNKEHKATGVEECEEYSDDETIWSPGVALSTYKRHTKGSCSCTKENDSSEITSCTSLKLPCKKKQRMEDHTVDIRNRADMCYTESKENRSSASCAKDLSAFLKQECLASKKFCKENTVRELENREKCCEECINSSCTTSIHSPLHFGKDSDISGVENVDTHGKENVSKRDNKDEVAQRKRQGQQRTSKRKSKRSLTNITGNRRFCGIDGGEKCSGVGRDAEKKESKEVKKAVGTILNDINRKNNVMKFKPLESHVDEKHAFRIHRIMYSTHLGEGLYRSHILNNIDPSNKGARMLALNIFCSKPHEENNPVLQGNNLADQSKQVTKLPKSLRRSLSLIRKLIHNYKKFKVHTCLKRYCPSSKSVKKLLQSYRLHKKRLIKDSSIRFDTDKQKKLYDAAFNDNIPSYKVFLFVKRVCTRILPPSLLESKSNWKVFYKNLKRFFTLGKHEFITLPMIMKGIKCSHCTWTYKSTRRPKHVSRAFSTWQRNAIENFVLWIVAKFVMPLLKTCFYITESGQHRKRVFYFRRSSWAAIECLARDTCCSKNFVEVRKSAVTEAISNGNACGCGKIRVIPKANKLRPIINMRRTRNKTNEPVSVGFQVDRLLHVLKFLAKDQPQLLGAAVSDMDDINNKLKRFRKTMEEAGGSGSNLYFIASDIECCFDSIPHDKLIDVTKSALGKSDYLIRKYSTTSFVMFKQCLTITKRVASRETETFPVFIEKYLNSRECTTSNSIITDGVFYGKEKKDQLCDVLWKHIKQTYVQFGSRYYRLNRGIAQGSVISTYLCNILYGHMEHTHLNEFINSDKCILMRWTDDFLLITSSKQLAGQLLEKLKAGFPEYGCCINIEKSKTNLPTDISSQTNAIQRVNATWFPWCNILVNTKTLEVRLRYDRYIGKSIGDSYSLRLDSRPGRRLMCSMMQQVRTQTTAIIIDPVLNSRENILTNVYQIFCFVAIKLNHQILNLPQDGQPNSNPKFFCLVISCIFKAFYRQYRRVHGKVCSNRVPLISKTDMKSLYYDAILNVLKKRKASYIKLIKLITPTAKRHKTRKIDIAKIKEESRVFDNIR